MTSYRNELRWRDTCSANPACARPPSAAPDTSFVPRRPTAPRRSDEYGACTGTPRRLDDRSGCHSPYRDTNAAGLSPSARVDPPRSLRWSAPGGIGHCDWPGPRRRPADPRRPLPARCVLPRSWLDLSGLAQFGPPHPSFAQGRIGRLPLPVDAAQFLAVLDQDFPDAVQHFAFDPPLERAMDRTVVGKRLGELIPLTAAPHPEDDRVQRTTRIDAFATGPPGRIVFGQDRFYDVP